jgi:hypothetical protein
MKPATLNAFAGGSMMTFGPPVADNMPVTLLITGHRRKRFLDLDEWRRFSPQCRSFFECAFCREQVVIFRVAVPGGEVVVQSCRCTTLKFEPALSLFRTQEEWTEWQTDYLREQADPAPVQSLKEGILTGALDQQTNDWLSRRGGLPAGLQFHPGTCKINAGEASISISDQSLAFSVDHHDPQNNQKIVDVVRQMQEHGLEPPERMLIAGDDPDYVWPEHADTARIKGLPYRCSNCRAWIRQAPLAFQYHDRVLSCFCHTLILRTDIAAPANYREWRDLLERERIERVKHQANDPVNRRN